MFKKMKAALDRLLPVYTRLPLALVVGMNMLAYYGTRLIGVHLRHYELALPLDAAIPFVPAFIVIYILAYVQWITGFVRTAAESREVCYRYLSGEIIAKIICLILFLLLPTTLIRPEVSGNGLFERLTRLIYSMDRPDNLFPSLHCLESWLCFRGALARKGTGRAGKMFSLIFTLSVFASTVLVKQHVLVDILAGVAVCEIGLLISKCTGADRVLRRLNRPFDRPANPSKE